MMNQMSRTLCWILLFPAVLCASAVKWTSPDGRLEASLDNQSGLWQWSLQAAGRLVMEPAPLGISLNGAACLPAADPDSVIPLSDFEKISSYSSAGIQTEYYNSRELVFKKQAGAECRIEARLFNGGFAWRYKLSSSGRVTGEDSGFRLPEKSKVWVAERPNRWKLQSYAGYWMAVDADQLPTFSKVGPLQGMPLTVELPGGGFALISEAALADYSGMRLKAQPGRLLTADFTEGAAGFAVNGPVVSPWRVVLYANDLNVLVNSAVIPALNPRPDPELYADTSWIQPGLCAWRWWSNRDSSPEGEKQFIDYAAALGFKYSLVDDGWKKWNEPWAQLAAVTRYANSKKVRTLIWCDYKDISDTAGDYGKMRGFLDQLQSVGASGAKLDFFNAESKDRIDFERRALVEAAKRKLVIVFHGIQKPSGETRTFPNELTREGIRGIELNKMPEGPISAEHNCALPFTRLVVGYGDYTPLAFSAPGATTWAHQLATVAAFNSRLQVIAEDPGMLLNDSRCAPALDFIKAMPTAWDETRILPGSRIGDLVISARRKNGEWWLAVLNNSAQKVKLTDCSFLGGGIYRAEILKSPSAGSLAAETVEKVDCSWAPQFSLAAGDGLLIRFIPSGLFLEDAACRLSWEKKPDGWHLAEAAVKDNGGRLSAGAPSGEYTVLYSADAPDRTSADFFLPGHAEPFPEPVYRYTVNPWKEAVTAVALNTAGQALRFFPSDAVRLPDGSLRFTQILPEADLTAVWSTDSSYAGDVQVQLTLTAKRDGWFSIASPTLAITEPDELAWADVPGYFRGSAINTNLVLALAYGYGLPALPVLARERGVATLAPLISNRAGVTRSVMPAPGTAADPWPVEHAERKAWNLGLSHMDRFGRLSPTLYHPVLGEQGSQLRAGESVSFSFRYTLRREAAYDVIRHAAYDVFGLRDFLEMKKPARSMSSRLQALRQYVVDDQTSLWRTEEFENVRIGAQAYLGGVHGSDKDAMKNSDYGAMWMLAQQTGDPLLTQNRLPFARDFKLKQQQTADGFFQGAARGQYYLSKSHRFTEEWGDYVEPVGLTYYMLIDLGNTILFDPSDSELRERFRLAADRLLAWQYPDGHWETAYDHETERPLFTETPDYRPTFYGALVAYRILGDAKYLEAARRGADWFIANAVKQGRFLGVCGDNRFMPDFATVQSASALLDLYDLAGAAVYRDAAVRTARFYTESVFTHPMATLAEKTVLGAVRKDWEISQIGLTFEHGGSIGSAAGMGPILLASHAGFFVRLSQLTGDPFFRDLARASTAARDAFVHPETGVASYYWISVNKGAGPYPHHAWWQIGWMTDYLLAEAEYRSGGQIHFPRGFMAPKVGPHSSYGFAPGTINGEPVNLIWLPAETGNPAVDYIAARSVDGKRTFIVLLNNSAHPAHASVKTDGFDAVRDADLASWGMEILAFP